MNINFFCSLPRLKVPDPHRAIHAARGNKWLADAHVHACDGAVVEAAVKELQFRSLCLFRVIEKIKS